MCRQQNYRIIGFALLALAFLLAAIPTVPYWLELTTIVVGGSLLFCGLPWRWP